MSTIALPPATNTDPASSLFEEIEAVLGFRPEHSLAIRVQRPRLPSAMLRIDLPPSLRGRPPRSRGGRSGRGAGEIEEASRFAHTVTGMVAQLSGARTVDIVVYLDQTHGSLGRLVHEVSERLHAGGFRLAGAYRVARGSWSRLVATRTVRGGRFEECGARTRLPPALAHPPGSPAGPRARAHDPADHEVDRDAHHGAFVPVPRPAQRRLVRALATVAALERRQVAPERDLVDELLEWQNVLAPDAGTPADARAIALAWSLRTTSVRDCVLMLCAWGFEAAIVSALDAPRAGDSGAAGDLLETVLGTGARAPAPGQLRRSIDVLRAVAECVPDSLAAPLLSMLAWLEWCRGRGSAAAGYLDAAHAADEGYRFAHLLRQMMGRGRLPEWIA